MRHFQFDFLHSLFLVGVFLLPLAQSPGEPVTHAQETPTPDPPKPQLADTSHSFMGEHAAQSYGLIEQQVEWIAQGAWDEDHCATFIYPPSGSLCVPAINGGYHSWDPDTGEYWNEPSIWPAFGSGLSRAKMLFANAIDAYSSGDLETAYLWLGRSMHLLGDVSTPAHVHLDMHLPGDADPYESWLSEHDYLNTTSWIEENPPGSMWVMDFKDLAAWDVLTDELKSDLEIASQLYGERISGQALWELGPVGEDPVIFRLMYLLAEEADNWDSDDVDGEKYPGDLADPAYLALIRDATFPMLSLHSTALLSYFEARVQPPSAPDLISPTDGERTLDDPPTFTWTSLGIEAEYKIEIDESLDFDQPLVSFTLTDTTFTPDNTLDGGYFYWRVKAITDTGTGDWSPVWQFTIVTEPAAPELLTPEDGMQICDTTPAFTWSAVDQAREYGLEIADNDAFESPQVSVNTMGNTYTHVQPLSQGAYYWRVNGRNEFFTGPWSTSWRVNILDVPAIPVLLSPGDNMLIGDWPPTLTWESVERASAYRLQVDDSPDFLTPTVDLEGLIENSHTPTSLSEGAYYWRVAADGDCAGEWSPVWNFDHGLLVSLPLVLR